MSLVVKYTRGMLEGKKFAKTRRERDEAEKKSNKDLFVDLEQKYGKLKVKGQVINKHDRDVNTTKNDDSANIEKVKSDSKNVKSVRNAKTGGLIGGIRVVDESYQSEFLKTLKQGSVQDLTMEDGTIKQNNEEISVASTKEVADSDELDWTQKVSRLKEAVSAAEFEDGWDGFERVFLISAVYGDGVEDVKVSSRSTVKFR